MGREVGELPKRGGRKGGFLCKRIREEAKTAANQKTSVDTRHLVHVLEADLPLMIHTTAEQGLLSLGSIANSSGIEHVRFE